MLQNTADSTAVAQQYIDNLIALDRQRKATKTVIAEGRREITGARRLDHENGTTVHSDALINRLIAQHYVESSGKTHEETFQDRHSARMSTGTAAWQKGLRNAQQRDAIVTQTPITKSGLFVDFTLCTL
jgi:hypothetical protein